MKQMRLRTVGAVERDTLINKKQSMKNALLNIYARDR